MNNHKKTARNFLSSHKVMLAASTAAMLTFTISTSHAEEAARAPAASDGSGSSEIVVTAQRREESVGLLQ